MNTQYNYEILVKDVEQSVPEEWAFPAPRMTPATGYDLNYISRKRSYSVKIQQIVKVFHTNI